MLASAGRISTLLALSAPLALALGCGASTPPANAPARNDTAVVNLDAPAPSASASASAKPEAPPENGEKRYAIKGPADNPDPHVSRQVALREAAEFGQIGLLNSGAVGGLIGVGSGGVVGGVVGGVPGGGGTGYGIGGGGTGYGIGSIGTIGSGSGYVAVSGSSSFVFNGVVTEFHDTTALGLSIEYAVRGLHDRMYGLRGCYVAARDKQSGLAGTVRLRFAAKDEGTVAYVWASSADIASPELMKCLEKELTGMYVGSISTGAAGVAETEISFRPEPSK